MLRATEDLNVPKSLSFFREISISGGLVMFLVDIIVGLIAPALVPKGGNLFMVALNAGLSFGGGLLILLYGVRLLVNQIIPAFQGISEKLVPGAKPAFDIPILFNYKPNAVIIGFISAFITSTILVLIANTTNVFGRKVMLDRKPIMFTSQMERLEGYGTALASTVAFKPGDVLILHSVSGRNPVIIDLALAAKNKGVKIIGLTNVTYSRSVTSRHSSGKHLFEVADIVIDNHGDIGDAACQLKGALQKVGPTSTVIGATILNTIIVEASQQLVQQGIGTAPVFYSANLDGGDEKNQQLVNEYQTMIHYDF